MTGVRTGADRLVAEEFRRLHGRRVGLICNHTAVESARLVHLADAMHAHPKVHLVRLFAPEHGIRGEAQDMVGVDHGVDPATGIEVHSLYGHSVASLTPPPETLSDLDVLVFDIQDVGSRYYTFAATMALCMKAAKEAGIPLLVLDRPNPLGGERIEGGPVEPGFESFVGLYSVPARHGMTVGELALYLAAVEPAYGCTLEVLEMERWRRRMAFEETGLVWIPPSPNMPTVDTAFVYPGMCLVEGTRLSEGRGTTRPFEQAGAPWVDGERARVRLEALFEAHGLGGVTPRPCTFRPVFHKWAGESCGGLFLHVRDRDRFEPWAVGLLFLKAIHDLWPERFEWRSDAYEFVEEVPAIDLLIGSDAFSRALAEDRPLAELLEAGRAFSEAFRRHRAEFLLYR
ncbi:MAG: DUF1343 domain-containing protein [Deltaproteobacteria bacterium]|nr:MAG: DUF1343 domain-containing protein [Deltaproteobacteria bacterium]